MATVATRNGKRGKRREVQFIFRGKHRVVRLGRVTTKQAGTVRLHIEQLIAGHNTGHPAADNTQAWLRDLPDEMHDRVARTGLCDPRHTYTIKAWIDRCIDAKGATDAAATTTRREQAKRFALAHFDHDRDLRTVTPGDADDFELFMRKGKLAEATIRKRLADVRAWFAAAVRHRLIDENPFADIKVTVPATLDHHYVTAVQAHAVMAELPNARLRAVFALARWGGLRTPSEHVALKWDDVDWHRSRFVVQDVKRKRERTVPMFPELVPPLREWFEQVPVGSVQVFPGMSRNSSALVTATERAIKSAGLERWPRLFQNLRASRETELIADAMQHGRDITTVCGWIGNSPEVAMKHYMMSRQAEGDMVAAAVPSVGAAPKTSTAKG